ncbi:11876_t:CDS:1, partial [Ambispora gerdemannii]
VFHLIKKIPSGKPLSTHLATLQTHFLNSKKATPDPNHTHEQANHSRAPRQKKSNALIQQKWKFPLITM